MGIDGSVGISPSTKSSREAGGYAGCVVPTAFGRADCPQSAATVSKRHFRLFRGCGALRITPPTRSMYGGLRISRPTMESVPCGVQT